MVGLVADEAPGLFCFTDGGRLEQRRVGRVDGGLVGDRAELPQTVVDVRAS